MRIHHHKKKAYKYKPQRRGHKSNAEKVELQWTKKLFALGVLIATIFIIYPYGILDQSFEKESESIIEKKLNLKVSEINVFGNDKVSVAEVQSASGILIGSNIHNVNLEEVRAKIEEFSWIEKASVERKLPSIINVRIKERVPKAVYSKEGYYYLIDDLGNILQKLNNKSEAEGFIVVQGVDANIEFSNILDEVYEIDEIYNNIKSLTRLGKRRWDILLNNETLLKLPEEDIKDALNIISDLDKQNKILAFPTMVDLRFTPNKIYVRF